MLLISHRGNTNGVDPSQENDPNYIDKALERYHVEIDVRLCRGQLLLGHDVGQYLVDKQWLVERADKLLVHCKDYASLSELTDTSLRTFYHSKEPYVAIRNTPLVWCHNLACADPNSIVPLLTEADISLYPYLKVAGVCSDYISQL